MMTQEEISLLKDFNRNVERLLNREADEWGGHEAACKILPRSKEWYKQKRLAPDPDLLKGVDWRMSGNRIEYKLTSIISLKEKLSR